MPGLTELPSELLQIIVSTFDKACDIANLSRTCKALYKYVYHQGYRTFRQANFPFPEGSLLPSPFSPDPVFERDTVRALSVFSRNLERKSLVAQVIDGDSSKRKGPGVSRCYLPNSRQQTVRYQPAIDSRDCWKGSSWSSRVQIVAWGAGATLQLTSEELCTEDCEKSFHVHPKSIKFHAEGSIEGRDDITSVRLLGSNNEGYENVLVGRASGLLQKVVFGTAEGTARLTENLDTGVQVPLILDRSSDGLVAVNRGYNVIALFHPDHSQDQASLHLRHEQAIKLTVPQEPVPAESKPEDRLRALRFLGPRRLVAGFSGSSPLFVTDVNHIDALRNIKLSPRKLSIHEPISTYSLLNIADTSVAGRSDGDCFLSGGFDGLIRLYDLRSSSPLSAFFEDTIDHSAIYSLSMLGRECIAAGGSRDSLVKFFDMRMPGTRKYHATDISVLKSMVSHDSPIQEQSINPWRRQGWNCITGANPKYNSSIGLPFSAAHSSVYALSSPSEASSTLFVGLSGCVLRMDFLELTDKWPEAMNGQHKRGDGHRTHEPTATNDKMLRSSMYERPQSHDKWIRLLTQTRKPAAQDRIPGLDSRWVDVNHSVHSGDRSRRRR